MAIKNITYTDKESLVTSQLPEVNKVTDSNMNEIKDVVNNNANELDKNTLQVATGTGTVNNTYISNVENNHWERVGKVVTYAFTMTASGTWDYTTSFISGLPKPVANTRFLGVNASNGNSPLMRFLITTNGTIQNAYSQAAPEVNQVIEGQITYITSE